MKATQIFMLLILLSVSLTCHASDMGTPGIWFSILFVLGFMGCGVVYLLCAAVFIPQLKDKEVQSLKVAYMVPIALISIPMLFLLSAGLGEGFIVFGLATGFLLATFLYSFALKKYKDKYHGE